MRAWTSWVGLLLSICQATCKSPSDIGLGALHTHLAPASVQAHPRPHSPCWGHGTGLQGTGGLRWLNCPVTEGKAEAQRVQVTYQRSGGLGSRPRPEAPPGRSPHPWLQLLGTSASPQRSGDSQDGPGSAPEASCFLRADSGRDAPSLLGGVTGHPELTWSISQRDVAKRKLEAVENFVLGLEATF